MDIRLAALLLLQNIDNKQKLSVMIMIKHFYAVQSNDIWLISDKFTSNFKIKLVVSVVLHVIWHLFHEYLRRTKQLRKVN